MLSGRKAGTAAPSEGTADGSKLMRVNLANKGVCIAGMAIQRRSEASRRVTSAAFVAYTLSANPVLLPRYSNMRNPLDNDCQRVFLVSVPLFFISAVPPIMEKRSSIRLPSL